MISLARLALDRRDSGVAVGQPELDAIPQYQWEIYYEDLAPLCPSSIDPGRSRQRNALRIELLPSTDRRCSHLSPDGRGETLAIRVDEDAVHAALAALAQTRGGK